MKITNGIRSLRVAGLFAGIGGIELGLGAAGHHTELLCEIDPWAAAVLKREFPGVALHDDISTLRALPKGIDLLSAGFPCQDISLAGTREGLHGARSGLVFELIRLMERHEPEFVLMENVLHLLRLGSGAAMRWLLDLIEGLGYRWAYRVVDTRGFGLPQRRLRVVILASLGDVDPASVLFADDVEPKFDDAIRPMEAGHLYGFYWTEGRRGVGWAKDAVPTIKGGSGIGIPSPPAVFDPMTGFAGTPSIVDAERLQGFVPGWTDVIAGGKWASEGTRWRMVGNAVSVPVAEWLGDALARPVGTVHLEGLTPINAGRPMPKAAVGSTGGRFVVQSSTHVRVSSHKPIGDFLSEPLKPLSEKALRGYLHRARTGHKKFPGGFLEALEEQAGGAAH